MSSRSVARRRRRKRSPLSSRSLARRRRRRRSSRSLVARAPLPDNDDLLEEILLRLRPSSLPRASAVCKRWRRLVADPRFLDRFCAHHRKPPLLGFFDCRHGRVLVKDRVRKEIVVWTPMTGEQRCVAVPPLFKKSFLNGAFSHFKVVLVCKDRKEKKLLAFVYSSDTGVWGNLISIEVPSHIRDTCTHGSLVGNAFYWLLSTKDGILKFDLDMQSLALIKGPPVANNFCRDRRRIIQTENGVVGLAILYYPHLEIWQMDVDFHGVATWDAKYMAYSEDIDAIFIYVNTNVYMVELKLMQSKRLHEGHHINNYHPFTSLYTPGDYSYLVFILQE
ncbi:hypothetical protein VPH35_000846 [Triticum aestivum]